MNIDDCAQQEARRMEDEKLRELERDLYRPFVRASDFKNLAFACHFEADWYRKIALWWVRSGIATFGISLISLVVVNMAVAMHIESFPLEAWIGLNATVCVIAIYSIQLIGKQIVATRELITAYGERALFIQFACCALSQEGNETGRRELRKMMFGVLAERLPSPFDKGKVAGSANLDFLSRVPIFGQAKPGETGQQADATDGPSGRR